MSDSLQWAILTPLLLLTVLGLIQGGLYLHGRNLAANTAVAAAEEAAQFGATAGQAEALASSLATRGGLVDVHVQVVQEPTLVRAVVEGRMPTFIDVGQTFVQQRATRPRERVTQP